MDPLVERYSGYRPPAIGYTTVRDFCDSVDHLPALATACGDLKDAQRPWMVKAILGTVPRGGKVAEIGAGQPLVADVLARLGYEVTVVDPYDGSGNGPREYEYFREAYPHIRFVRAIFNDATPGLEPGSLDAVYSISVLEHVPIAELPRLCAGIRRFLAPGRGRHLHAIDHVQDGRGDRFHLEHLRVLADEFGIERPRLDEVLERSRGDVETYILSAESHNRWRGATSYDEFPMRRVISIQVALPAAA